MTPEDTLDVGKAIVLYDGDCPFCRKSVALLKRLDWLHKLAYRSCRDVEHWPETPVKLDYDRMVAEMHLLTPDRKEVFAGFSAFRWMAARLPMLWAVYPLLYIPGVLPLGNRAYRWVARNRFSLVPCEGGVCAVPPRKKVSAS